MKNLFKLALFYFIMFSCSQTDIKPDKNENINEKYWTKTEINEYLFSASKLISKIANDPTVRNELISHATNENGGEVYVSFYDLFNPPANAINAGAFAKKFKVLATPSIGGRSTGLTDSLSEFLVEQKFAIYAPYLAENFENTTNCITASW